MDYVSLDWLILIVSFVISIGSQIYINSKYKKTGEILSQKGLNGSQVARKILDDNGLYDVKVSEVSGMLSDHYDPRNKTVRLSSEIFDEATVASLAVAAHECGHAIQDKEGYTFLRIRSAIVPFVNIASYLGYISILIGLFLGAFGFFTIGIICEAIILIFQLITLPVEFNASSRALNELKRLNLVSNSELSNCRGMLGAAAMTYVASVATSILQIMRLLMLARRDD